jgi:hypothetical protein
MNLQIQRIGELKLLGRIGQQRGDLISSIFPAELLIARLIQSNL